MPQQLQACLDAGADLHVAKPITVESLHTALDGKRRAGFRKGNTGGDDYAAFRPRRDITGHHPAA